MLDLDAQAGGLADELLDPGTIGLELRVGVAVAIDWGQKGSSIASTTISVTLDSIAAWSAMRNASGSNGTASVARTTGRGSEPATAISGRRRGPIARGASCLTLRTERPRALKLAHAAAVWLTVWALLPGAEAMARRMGAGPTPRL